MTVAQTAAGLSLWYAPPFAGLLLSIAIMPLVAHRFWEHHYGKISAFWAALFWIPFAAVHNGPLAFQSLLHTALQEYLPFVILVGGLYVVAGGLVVEGKLSGTPLRSTALLACGALFASMVGTTGASMILIRPLLRGLQERKYKTHTVVFFIFLVANIGGSLTPIGDPPLFLGFLQGIPFFWTLHLAGPMLLVSGILLGAYYALDSYFWRKEKAQGAEEPLPSSLDFGLRGVLNLAFLAGIVGAVILSGVLREQKGGILLIPAGENGHAVKLYWVALLRDSLIVAFAWASWKFTALHLREENRFSWEPVLEVARLFAGIFVCLIPILQILHEGQSGALGGLLAMVQSPMQYFWITGVLSAFLDNAPTWLLFFNVAGGAAELPRLLTEVQTLLAISCGAVFLGAYSYIGNAPNFLVRNIAEENGVRMPSFFGFLGWSTVFLIPAVGIMSWVFF